MESDHLTLVARFTAYNELRMMFPENTPYPPEFAPLLTPTDRLQHVPAGVLPTLSPEKQARLDALSREYGLDDGRCCPRLALETSIDALVQNPHNKVAWPIWCAVGVSPTVNVSWFHIAVFSFGAMAPPPREKGPG
jgi:hypothetical protein